MSEGENAGADRREDRATDNGADRRADAAGRQPSAEERRRRAEKPQQDSLKLHAFYRGKMETVPKCVVRDLSDFTLWYSPGVAGPCKAIHENPETVYDYTNKWNTVAVVSDGSRVLGLGDIGPKAGLPVMEGKALLYRYLGGVDSVPIVLDTKDPDEIIRTVLLLQPTFGGINLEDISQPKCFRILETLRRQAEIPVWHDDQQGTATVTLAGLLNALRVVNKKLSEVRIAFIGAGAANVACARLIFGRGADPGKCSVVDSTGILGQHREDIAARRNDFPEKWDLCEHTNAEGREGSAAEAMRNADVVISLAKPGPGTIEPDWIRGMAPEPIVFACANPVPEIWPWEAEEAGAAVVATGRSDFPNQVNNSLCFPGIFRGALDVRATTITDEMCYAAAEALANTVVDTPEGAVMGTPADAGAPPKAGAETSEATGPSLRRDHILPTMEEWSVFIDVAVAVGMKAMEQGVARRRTSPDELRQHADYMIRRSRDVTQDMMARGHIAAPDHGASD